MCDDWLVHPTMRGLHWPVSAVRLRQAMCDDWLAHPTMRGLG